MLERLTRKSMKCNNILEAIGHTPLVRLNRLTKDCKAEVYVKADYLNPGGSVKDRIGISMIDEAERKGLLKPGGTIIEGTSGNTGIGLALVAAVRGYKLVFTITDKQSKEKVDLLKALGAEVIVCPTAVEPDDPRSYYSVAKKLAQEIPNSFYPNQYENPMNPEAHYRTTGPEIWEDSEGKITHFVCGMGTGGTISGVGRYLKEKNPNVKIIGVDPIGSLYYEFFKTGKVGKARTYVVEGIGEDIFPSTMDFKVLDDVLQVNDQECFVVRAQAGEERRHFHRRLGRRLRFGGAARGARTARGQFRGGVSAGHGHALPQQGLQRRMDARARLRAIPKCRSRPRTWWPAKHRAGKVRETDPGAARTRPSSTRCAPCRSRTFRRLPVFEENTIVGTIYEDQILNLALQGKDLRKLVIREVMSKPLPQVPRDAPVERVTHLLSHESPAVFVVMGEGNYEILTKYDLMGTIAELVEQVR